jgi:gas vesicle protein
MKDESILLLAGVGVVGYGLISSGFFKNLGGVSSGVGDAVGGVGQGVGMVGQSAGINISELLSAFGQLGTQSNTLIKETGGQVREVIYQVGTDTGKVADKLGNIAVDTATAGADISGTLANVNKGFWDAINYTWNLNEPTNIFSGIGSAIGSKINENKSSSSSSKSTTTATQSGTPIKTTPQTILTTPTTIKQSVVLPSIGTAIKTQYTSAVVKTQSLLSNLGTKIKSVFK